MDPVAIKKRPLKPIRESKFLKVNGDLFYTIGEILDRFSEITTDPYLIQIDKYGDYVELKASREETDEEFQKRLDKYELELEEYNKWYEKNREYLEQREENGKKIKRLEIGRKIMQLQKELEGLE